MARPLQTGMKIRVNLHKIEEYPALAREFKAAVEKVGGDLENTTGMIQNIFPTGFVEVNIEGTNVNFLVHEMFVYEI